MIRTLVVGVFCCLIGTAGFALAQSTLNLWAFPSDTSPATSDVVFVWTGGAGCGQGGSCTRKLAISDFLAASWDWSNSSLQTFGTVNGKTDIQSGTTYTFAAADCGKTVLFTNSGAVTATIPASIVPASGTSCIIGVVQAGASKVSVNGTAVSAAILVSAHSYTGTSGTAGSTIGLALTTVSGTPDAFLTGDGS